MATALSDLRDEVRARVGNRDTAAIPNARIDFCLRHAIIQLASPAVFRQDDLETTVNLATVSGTDTYSLGMVLYAIYSVRDTTTGNKRRIAAVGPQWMDELEKTAGPPLRYCRWGGVDDTGIELDPIPDGVYNLVIRVYGFPSFTTSGGVLTGDSPLRESMDECVLLGAEYRLWTSVLQNPERGRIVKNDQADVLATIMSGYEGELYDSAADILMPDMLGTYGAGR